MYVLHPSDAHIWKFYIPLKCAGVSVYIEFSGKVHKIFYVEKYMARAELERIENAFSGLENSLVYRDWQIPIANSAWLLVRLFIM